MAVQPIIFSTMLFLIIFFSNFDNTFSCERRILKAKVRNKNQHFYEIRAQCYKTFYDHNLRNFEKLGSFNNIKNFFIILKTT